MMKPVITAHQKQTVEFLLIFYINRQPLFQALLDRFFSSYLMLCILVNFLGHQLQNELPQTQGLLVYLSYYKKFQYAKTHDKKFRQTKPNISLSFLLVSASDHKAASNFWSSFQSLQLVVVNHKVNYGLIRSKVQIKTRNATRCSTGDDFLQLSFTLKISIFSEACI